jgi:hypothetical protein
MSSLRLRPARALTVALTLSLPFVVHCTQGDAARPLPPGAEPESVSQDLGACDVAGSPVTGAKLKVCVNAGEDQLKCLDAMWEAYMPGHTTAEALSLLQCYEDHDADLRVSCHPIAHSIGRNTFIIDKTIDKSFADCNQTCHSGCYHGVMERFLRGDSDSEVHLTFAELQAKIATACPPQDDNLIRFQCLHGLGHAILYYVNPDHYDLDAALELCEVTGGPIGEDGDEWARASCRGGAFMENLVAAEKEKRYVSPTDVHFPCDVIKEKYRNDCYAMQTSRMTEMGLNSDQIMAECRNAKDTDEAGVAHSYVDSCTQSMGRDLSDTVRFGKPRDVSAVCEKGLGDQPQWCTRGVIYALIDNTWDGKFAFDFCSTFSTPEGSRFCYEASDDYLKNVYRKTVADLNSECAQYAPGNALCTAAANR